MRKKLLVALATVAFLAVVVYCGMAIFGYPKTITALDGTKILLTDDTEAVKQTLIKEPQELSSSIDTLYRKPDSASAHPAIVPIFDFAAGRLVDTWTQNDPYGYFKADDPIGVVIFNDHEYPIVFSVDLYNYTSGYCGTLEKWAIQNNDTKYLDMANQYDYQAAPPEIEQWVVRPKRDVEDSGTFTTDDKTTARIQLDHTMYYYPSPDAITVTSDLPADNPVITVIQEPSKVIVDGLVPNATRKLTFYYTANTVTVPAGEVMLVPIALIVPKGVEGLPPMWEFDILVKAVSTPEINLGMFNVAVTGKQRWLIHMQME